MPCRIAINGYGRIGRCVLRALYEGGHAGNLQIVAINDLTDGPTLAHLTRYDSTHGRFQGEVSLSGSTLGINGDDIALSCIAMVDQLPWESLDVDLVLECSGAFSDRPTAEQHLERGAKRVLFSQPAEADVDATLVWGINHETAEASHTVLSAASCTTNCIVPVLQVLDNAFGIENGMITTIHSAMNDQPVIDSFHSADLRKTRSAMNSIIPVDTALAKGIERILPRLAGKLEAQAIRVPTVNVSAMELTVLLKSECDAAAINALIEQESRQLLPNVLGYTHEPLASCDFNHDKRSAIVDLTQTRTAGHKLAKLLVWFDNEWAYGNRMLDIASYLANLGQSPTD